MSWEGATGFEGPGGKGHPTCVITSEPSVGSHQRDAFGKGNGHCLGALTITLCKVTPFLWLVCSLTQTLLSPPASWLTPVLQGQGVGVCAWAYRGHEQRTDSCLSWMTLLFLKSLSRPSFFPWSPMTCVFHIEDK